jgi:hypothetical protein
LLDLETRVANQKATLQTVKRRIDIGEKMVRKRKGPVCKKLANNQSFALIERPFGPL